MIEFIKSIDGVVIKLLKHIKTTAVIDIIMKLISMDDISGSQGIVDVSNNSSEARVIMWSYYTFLLLCGVIIPFCYYVELLYLFVIMGSYYSAHIISFCYYSAHIISFCYYSAHIISSQRLIRVGRLR